MKDLKFSDIMFRFFAVANCIMLWYSNATADRVITKEECAELGLSICDLLGVKTDIKLD
jgi:hypothetical protein